MQKNHIAFIEDTHLHGGTQIWVSQAIRYFLAQGIKVTLLAPENSWIVKEVQGNSVQVCTYDYDDIIGNFEKYETIWKNALYPCCAAICTVHPPRKGFHCSVFAGYCIKKYNLGTTLMPKTGTIVPSYQRGFYIPNETISCKVIAIAEFTRKYLLENYNIPEEKVTRIYQGTEVERFSHSEERRRKAKNMYSIPESAFPVLASVGSFETRKGQVVLLDAMKKIMVDLPDTHVVFIGDGPDEQMLRLKTKHMGLENHVSFFSFTKEPEYIYELVDILTLPSLYKEGLPNVILEAMAMGIPVIASKLAGIPEAVIDGETGFLFEAGNYGELANSIINMVCDKKKYFAMQKKAQTFVQQKFSKTKQFEAFKHFFIG